MLINDEYGMEEMSREQSVISIGDNLAIDEMKRFAS